MKITIHNYVGACIYLRYSIDNILYIEDIQLGDECGICMLVHLIKNKFKHEFPMYGNNKYNIWTHSFIHMQVVVRFIYQFV